MFNNSRKPPKPGRKLIATWLSPDEAEAFRAAAEPRGGIAKVLRDYARRVIRAARKAA